MAWYCDHAVSERTDKNTYNVCGSGKHKTEVGAKEQAFKNAQKEFKNICRISDYCKKRKVDVSPGRTDCKMSNKFFRCKRLLKFRLGELKDDDEYEEELENEIEELKKKNKAKTKTKTDNNTKNETPAKKSTLQEVSDNMDGLLDDFFGRNEQTESNDSQE
jgi:hypothetical protein